MSHTLQRSLVLPLALAAALATPVLLADFGTAHADVGIRVSGRVKVRVATPRVKVHVGGAAPRTRHVRVRRRAYVPPPPPVTLYTGGYYASAGVYGGGFAEPPPPPPPPCDAGCGQAASGCYGPQPSDPEASCEPPARSACGHPATACSADMSVERPRLPRWGIGVFAGSTEVEGGAASEELGLIGRFRLTHRLHIEGEVANSKVTEDRIDRRVGGALVFELSPRSRFSPQVIAGAGRSMVAVGTADGAWQAGHGYGELGVGLRWRLSDSLQIAADFRGGVRAPLEDEPTDMAVKNLVDSIETEERYTRGRLSLMLSF